MGLRVLHLEFYVLSYKFELYKIIEFRNDYPAFNGKFKVIDTNNNELILSWEKDHKECTLYCDLLTNKSIIKYIGDNENLSIFNI